MDRLTIRNSGGSISQPTNTTVLQVFQRLAAYEDTGLTPEEIAHTLENFSEILCYVTHNHMSKTNYTVEAMKREIDECWQKECDECEDRNLAERYNEAEAEGRLIALLRKVGDRVYDISEFLEHCPYPEMYEYDVDYIGIGKSEDGRIVITIDCMDYYIDDFGKTVFLTREEAEAALETV